MPKMLDIEGNSVTVSLSISDFPVRPKEFCKSGIQYDVGQILRNKYKFCTILEEWTVPGSGGLKIDFFIPQRSLAIEVNGRQHYEFSKFFHKDQKGFDRQKNRDIIKKNWCDLNGIELIIVDSIEEAKDI
jgi:hypothetical protein